MIRFALSRTGRAIGGRLQRLVGVGPSAATWQLTHGPTFANEMAMLTISARGNIELLMERARPDESGDPILEEVVRTRL